MRVLVVNAGSSSLKLSVLDDDGHTGGWTVESARALDSWDGDDEPVADFAAALPLVDAVGHRVVHGGVELTRAVLIDDVVLAQLRDLSSLAPLHQPRALAAIEAARRALPGAPQVACFDTAFHSTIPPAAHTYAVPAEWRSRWPIRRFGFHGLSHAYTSRRVAELAARPVGEMRIVSCHLGAGASLCAIDRGRSVDTTMGFTPLEGLVMATRAGSVDPGLVLWLIQHGGLAPDAVLAGLEHDSGLLGIAGSADMRDVIAGCRRGDAPAALAFDVYTHRLLRELGAMRAVLGRVDAVAFTGGVGEHVPEVRAACGLDVDPDTNAATTTDGEISAARAAMRSFVVTAREDAEIARQARDVVA